MCREGYKPERDQFDSLLVLPTLRFSMSDISSLTANDTDHYRGVTDATIVNPTESPTSSHFANGGDAQKVAGSPTTTTVPSASDTDFPLAIPPDHPPDRPGRTLVLCFDGTGDQ